MYPQPEDSNLAHGTSNDLVSSRCKPPKSTADTSAATDEANRDSPLSQGIAPLSPRINDSDDSVPALNLSGSPSPTDEKDVSLLSDASFGALGPLTPVRNLFEEVAISNTSGSPLKYQRIHSTPYPKPRLPLQLTPHPQSRIVSLPEWSRNRNPFLEAVRNLRSVSSPARLKPAPLSPIHAQLETNNNLSEVSGDSSGSSAVPPSFAALTDSEQSAPPPRLFPNQSRISYASREQLYIPPEGLFFTPPSSRSLVLTPPTTEPDRSLPKDRPAANFLQKHELSRLREGYSEEEVSSILQQMSIESSGWLGRSSLAASIPSRSSSPESVVFLSPMARFPRTFLGSKSGARPTSDGVTFSSAQMTLEPKAYLTADGSQEDVSTPYPVVQQPELPANEPQECALISGPEDAASKQNSTAQVTPNPGTQVARDPDWIMFDPPKPIPALHGPASLPYARCPSGAEGVVLDDQQEVGGVVWGLSDVERNPAPGGVSRAPIQATAPGNRTRSLDLDSEIFKKLNVNAVPFSHVQDRSAFNKQNVASAAPPILPDPQRMSTQPITKEKHVRFVDATIDGPSGKRPVSNPPMLAISSQAAIPEKIPNLANAPNKAGESLADILLNQIVQARTDQLRELQRAWAPPPRPETLEQLRRFGVPFRSHGLLTPPSTTSPLFASQFSTTGTSRPPMDTLFQQSSQQSASDMSHQRDMQSAPPRSAVPGGLTSASSQLLEFRPVNTGPGSLSNAKSIPLLKLRQRQHGDSLLQTKGLPKEGNASLAQSSAQKAPRMGTQEQPAVKHLPSHNNHTAPVSKNVVGELTPASTSMDQIGSNASASTNIPSPNRRRPRKSNKRGQVDASATQSRSPQKENSQASNPGVRKPSSRQNGRKKSSQGNCSDSLPQSSSRG